MRSIQSLLAVISAVLLSISICDAVTVGKGIVRIDDQNFSILSNNIPLNMTDTKISFGFYLNEGSQNNIAPKQVTVSLSNDNIESELYLYPNLLEQNVYELNLPIKSISKYLLFQDYIQIKIITGDPETANFNTVIDAGKIIPSDRLKKARSIELPVRFGLKEQIEHIFREAPTTLHSFISTQFVFLEVIMLCVLILAWNEFEATNLTNLTKFNKVGYLFLATIGLFEYYFFDYYLGTSIFTSLKRFTITGIFAIFFGSYILNDMYNLRLSNKR